MNNLCNLQHIFVNNAFSDFHVNRPHCIGLSHLGYTYNNAVVIGSSSVVGLKYADSTKVTDWTVCFNSFE